MSCGKTPFTFGKPHRENPTSEIVDMYLAFEAGEERQYWPGIGEEHYRAALVTALDFGVTMKLIASRHPDMEPWCRHLPLDVSRALGGRGRGR